MKDYTWLSFVFCVIGIVCIFIHWDVLLILAIGLAALVSVQNGKALSEANRKLDEANRKLDAMGATQEVAATEKEENL
ncbi:MAG: hypothetical protein HFF09_05870 [Oscillospiraceae bacterium]|nr:hypothetical protein [Oscillospiraceae bacterium]